MSDTDALDLALRLAKALDQREIEYAIGGALAYGVWAIPRGTQDVDLNVFTAPDRLDAVFEALSAEGVQVDPATAADQAARDGMFVAWHGSIRVDVFVPSITFSDEARRTRRRHRVLGDDYWFLSAEALAVFKLLFFRGKDLVDLERLLAVMGRALDTGYVRRQLVEMMGDDDPRVTAWDAIVASQGGS